MWHTFNKEIKKIWDFFFSCAFLMLLFLWEDSNLKRETVWRDENSWWDLILYALPWSKFSYKIEILDLWRFATYFLSVSSWKSAALLMSPTYEE